MKVKEKNDYFRLQISRGKTDYKVFFVEDTTKEEVRRMLFDFFFTVEENDTNEKKISVNIQQKKSDGYGYANIGNMSVKSSLSTGEFMRRMKIFVEENWQMCNDKTV
jgi:hypothetical protein